jgi:hypothetical protein
MKDRKITELHIVDRADGENWCRGHSEKELLVAVMNGVHEGVSVWMANCKY